MISLIQIEIKFFLHVSAEHNTLFYFIDRIINNISNRCCKFCFYNFFNGNFYNLLDNFFDGNFYNFLNNFFDRNFNNFFNDFFYRNLNNFLNNNLYHLILTKINC